MPQNRCLDVHDQTTRHPGIEVRRAKSGGRLTRIGFLLLPLNSVPRTPSLRDTCTAANFGMSFAVFSITRLIWSFARLSSLHAARFLAPNNCAGLDFAPRVPLLASRVMRCAAAQ